MPPTFQRTPKGGGGVRIRILCEVPAMPREEEKAPPVFDHLGPREEERGFGVLGCGDIREEEDVAASHQTT